MLVYDIEIIRSPKFDPKKPNYEYAKGWDDHHGMSIACIGIYDYKDDHLTCVDMSWMENPDGADIHENQWVFELFADADLVIGYNNHRFDDPMMRSHGFNINEFKSYDILANIYAAVGLTGAWDYRTHGGYGLDAVCKANGIEGKSGDGAHAPFDWQDGKKKEVMDYCKNDVQITKDLVDQIFANGGLISPKTGKFVRIAMPYIG